MAVIYFFGKFILGYVTCFWGCSLLVPKTEVKRYISWFICVFINHGRYTALVVYNETGEISQFHIVIIIFLLYACTFGIVDFLKLDRWMRLKIGGWRKIDMLSEKDKRIIVKQENPKQIAKKYRTSS